MLPSFVVPKVTDHTYHGAVSDRNRVQLYAGMFVTQRKAMSLLHVIQFAVLVLLHPLFAIQRLGRSIVQLESDVRRVQFQSV